MNTQIYLLLVRKVNPHLPAPAKAAAMIKNFVMGDSLDAPFLKFIKVTGLSHSIGFGGEDKVTQVDNGQAVTYTTSTGSTAGGYDQYSQHEDFVGDTKIQSDRWGNRLFHDTAKDERSLWYTRHIGAGGAAKGIFSSFKQNQYININLPSHNELTFTKLVDNATPQLAYGCSAQEPFYFAGFFFRRRIGAGIDGMRLPYMGIGLNKCLITGWSLDGETEKITLKYKQIMWGTFDQVADINAPTGLSSRVWDSEKNEGGEKKEGYLLQALIAALTLAGTAAVKAMTGGFEDEVTDG